jgi:hypothetical protein
MSVLFQKRFLYYWILDKEPLIKLAMTRQENRHNRPGMDLVRDEVSYGVCLTFVLRSFV